MSHNRRRAYPKASYTQVDPNVAYGINPAAGAPAAASNVGGVPAAVPGYGGAYGQPQQQPVDQLAQGFQSMNINDQYGQYQQPQQQQQQTPYGQPGTNSPYGYGGSPQPAQSGYGASVPATGYGGVPQQQQKPVLPLNQLYSTDLLKELPPPIADLQFPPPPIILAPDLAATGGDSNPGSDYFRSTLNVVPNSSSLLKKSKLPFALVLRPYATLSDSTGPVPIVDDSIVTRCRRCRSYMNPFITFTENGRRWRCNFCGLQNDVPQAFDFNPITSAPANRMERHELNHSLVEFAAPKEYMVRPPQPLIYVFVLDVSQASIQNGLLATVTSTILESLDRIPNDDNRSRVAFMAVDSSLSFFEIPSDEETEKEISMMIVSDLEEVLIPSPDGIMANLKESRKNIEKLLTNFASYFANNQDQGSALGPALKSAHHLISQIGGKIICFTSTLPNLGEGKLTVRDENSVSGKPKESTTLLTPNNSFYRKFSIDCNKSQVTVDMFLTGSAYQDVATLSNLPRYTAGQTHFYPAWSANNVEDITKLTKEVSNHLSMEVGLEGVLRIRGSNGLKMNAFYGNFFNRSSDLCALPSMPRDQGYVAEVGIEEYIAKPYVYFQAAFLHTSCHGQRRIRVLTLALPVSKDLKDVYASADQLAITNYFAHRAIERCLSSSLDDARDFLNKQLIDILTMYKKEIVPGNLGSSSPLQLCTNLRMLPLLLHSLSKNIAFRGGRVPSDHRAAALNKLGTAPLKKLINFIYPSVYPLHTMEDQCGLPYEGEDDPYDFPPKKHGEIVLPEGINASFTSLEKYGLYLINNTSELFLYIGGDSVPELIRDVFGVSTLAEVKVGKSDLPELDNDFNIRIRNIINKIREGDDTISYLSLYVVIGPASNENTTAYAANRDIMPLRIWCLSDLVEDRGAGGLSYREYLGNLRDKIAS